MKRGNRHPRNIWDPYITHVHINCSPPMLSYPLCSLIFPSFQNECRFSQLHTRIKE